VKVLVIIVFIAAAIFLGACSKSQGTSPGGSQNGNPIIVNPIGSFPNPYSS
jgi:hypothetical protein